MAFGFPTPAHGLIVERNGIVPAVRAYLRAFGAAYCDSTEPVDLERLRADSVAMRAKAVAASASRPAHLLISLDAADRMLADGCGIPFVPCFPDPRLATLPDRADDARRKAAAPLRVCLFGPESTGKTTLAAALAREYGTVHVTEYVRGYLDATGHTGTVDDVPWIARGQRAAEIASLPHANRLLVHDTNLATILLWSEVLLAKRHIGCATRHCGRRSTSGC